MDMSRITRGTIALRRQRVDLRTVIGHAVEPVRGLIETRSHALTIETPRMPVWVDGDEIRLTQVVTNLLTNAAKYTNNGGHINLQLTSEGQHAHVRVRDDGIGIPADLLPHVFDLFTQAERGAARSEGGLGIGLTLVRKLVELHHGDVHGFSEGPGQGSEFVIQLPLASPAESGATEGRNVSDEHHRDARRILVVDDNADGAESLTVLLRLAGQDVRIEHDGMAALAVAESFRPDAVILDIGLSGLDGYEVAQRLRRMPGTQGSVLIALTGYSQDEDRLKSQQAGFDYHFIKPGDVNALLQAIARGRAR
jgi:CheY-like chemotaxis protein